MPGREVRRNERDGKPRKNTFDEPERRCREVREVPEKSGRKTKKKRFPEPKLDGNPQHVNAAARYSPTPSRVQYHRRARP